MPAPKKTEVKHHNRTLIIINEADLLMHTVSMETLLLPANTAWMLIASIRTSGSGIVRCYPNSEALGIEIANSTSTDQLKPQFIQVIDGGLMYAVSDVTGTWQLYLLGTLVQRYKV